MATVTSIANGGWIADAASVWDSGSIPGVADDAVIDGESVTLDDDATCSTTTVTSGTLTLDGARALTSDFDLSGGTLTAGAHNFTVSGDLVRTSGTGTGTGIWTQSGDGDLKWNDSVNYPAHLSIAAAGFTTTQTGRTYAGKWTLNGGTVALGTDQLIVRLPTADDFWSDTGTETWTFGAGGVVTFQPQSNRNQGAMCIDAPVDLVPYAGYTLTGTGHWDFDTNDLGIRSSGVGLGTVAPSKLTAGDVRLGNATYDDRHGALLCGGGSYKLASLAIGKADDTAGNAVDLGSSYWELSGNFNGAGNFAVTNTACHIQGGTLTDVTNGSTEPIHCHGTIDGTGNTNVDFDEHAPPGSLALMGAGI